MKASEQITQAARANGWTVTPDVIGNLTARRGRSYLDVEFSVRGGITYASLSGRRLLGAGRLARILDFLDGSK
jgi:hypothetical protein